MQKNNIIGSQRIATSPLVFKKYDIRGIINQELIIDDIYRITQAIATCFQQQDSTINTLVVGMDGRTHSPHIKEQVCTALQDHGINVIFLGICPTPTFYFANETLPASGGIMITASHNPKQYNGLKLMLHKKNVFDQAIVTIKELFFSHQNFPPATVSGTYQEKDIIEPYIDFLAKQFNHLHAKSIKAVIDCAHGATAAIIPQLVKRMNWAQVHLINSIVDGTFPAHEADPTKEENTRDLQTHIQEHPGYFGVGFDGDGDRMGAVTEHAIPIRNGDELSSLFCQAIKDKIGPFNLVVDIKCSSVLLKQFDQLNIAYTLSPCGVGFLRTIMQQKKALFGGEISCHFCFKDRYFGYDDGIYAMMRLFELIDKAGTTLQACYDNLPSRFCSPELRVACSHEQKWELVEHVKQQVENWPNSTLTTIDGIRLELPHGCITMRASNTEPVLSIRFEGTTQKNLDMITHEFYMLLTPHFDKNYLAQALSIKSIS